MSKAMGSHYLNKENNIAKETILYKTKLQLITLLKIPLIITLTSHVYKLPTQV